MAESKAIMAAIENGDVGLVEKLRGEAQIRMADWNINSPRGKALLQYRPAFDCNDKARWRLWVEDMEVQAQAEWDPLPHQIYDPHPSLDPNGHGLRKRQKACSTTPHSSKPTPKKSSATPHSSKHTPKKSSATHRSSKHTPKKSSTTPRSSKPTPKRTTMTKSPTNTKKHATTMKTAKTKKTPTSTKTIITVVTPSPTVTVTKTIKGKNPAKAKKTKKPTTSDKHIATGKQTSTEGDNAHSTEIPPNPLSQCKTDVQCRRQGNPCVKGEIGHCVDQECKCRAETAGRRPMTTTQTKTPLKLGLQNCNPEADFPDHHDVDGSLARDFAKEICTGDSIMMGPLASYSKTKTTLPSGKEHGFNFQVHWIENCATDVKQQDMLDPLGIGQDPLSNHCIDLFAENWEKCKLYFHHPT
jgi:hypothetical protein